MFFTLISGFLTGILTPFVKAYTDVKLQSLKSEVDGFKAAVGGDVELGKAFLDAQVQTNAMKAAANTWIGAKVIILVAGLPAAIHFGAVMLDSTFQFGWAIPKVPAPYDGYEWAIVQSFFIMAPVMPIASAASAWLARRK